MIFDPRELVAGTGRDNKNVTRRQLVGRAITDLSGVVTRSVQELAGLGTALTSWDPVTFVPDPLIT